MRSKKLSWVVLIVVIAMIAACSYVAKFGYGKQHLGKAEYIKLGLDLAGGVNITYEADNIGPYNKLGRTFNGLSVSVVIGEKILSTEENIKGFYTVIAKYGGETKQILMSSLREPYITTPGTVLYGGSVNMPYQGGGVITNPLNVSVSGSWYQINPLGGNAAVSWTPFDTVNIIRSFVF